MTTALLVIDMQVGLCTGQWAVFEPLRVLSRVNQLVQQARSAGVPVVFIQHEEADGILMHGTAGWQLAQAMDAHPGDVYVRKTTPNAFHQTNLHATLQDRGVESLIMCGLQTDFCVDTTVRQALALHYPVTLVADAHSTLDNSVLSAAQIIAHHNLTLSHMGSFGVTVRVLPTADVRMIC